jgi:effector-binding domain-containing protein
MLVREIKPVNFLFYRVETHVGELKNFVSVGQKIFAEALKNNLFITGPIQWHYFGFMGDVQRSFTLEIALPVGNVIREYDGIFHFKRTDLFRAVTSMHDGSWESIPASYEKLMHLIAGERLKATAVNREIYINIDFENPDANRTEIQVGIE